MLGFCPLTHWALTPEKGEIIHFYAANDHLDGCRSSVRCNSPALSNIHRVRVRRHFGAWGQEMTPEASRYRWRLMGYAGPTAQPHMPAIPAIIVRTLIVALAA